MKIIEMVLSYDYDLTIKDHNPVYRGEDNTTAIRISGVIDSTHDYFLYRNLNGETKKYKLINSHGYLSLVLTKDFLSSGGIAYLQIGEEWYEKVSDRDIHRVNSTSIAVLNINDSFLNEQKI